MFWGLLLSSRVLQRSARPPWLLDLHRFLGALTAAFTVAGGALSEGAWDTRRILPWLGFAAVLAIFWLMIAKPALPGF